jgi:hypothetical protein
LDRTICRVSVEPKSIENLHAESLLETLEHTSREGFTGGDGVAHTGKIKLGSIRSAVGQQRCIVRGNREKKGWAIAFDVGVNAFRSWAVRRKYAGGAGCQRKIASVPQSIREE